MEIKEMEKKLFEPFLFEEIKWRVGATFQKDNKNKAIAIPYLTRSSIQDRLDQVFGVTGWKNDFKEWGINAQLCGISFRLDSSGEWITKWDGAGNTEFEGVKGGLSDSFKRAATVIGIGRYLSKLSTAYVEVDIIDKGNNKKSVNICTKDLNSTLPYFYKKEIARIFGTTNSKKENIVSDDIPEGNEGNEGNIVPKHIVTVLEQLIHAKNVQIDTILSNYSVNALSELTMEQVDNAMQRLSNTKVA